MLHKTTALTFLEDLREGVAACLATKDEKPVGSAAIYGMASTLIDRESVDDMARLYLDSMYQT